MPKGEELVTARALAEKLGLSVETIWRYTREGKIPFMKLGQKQYRYKLGDVMRALDGSSFRKREVEYINSEEKFTYQDYLRLPEEPGYRFEVLEGMLVKEPSPSVLHQRVCRRLIRILEDYFWEVDPGGEVFCAPLDVTFDDYTVVQPDIFYVSGKQKGLVEEARINGPPTLVVEVISPSSSRKDRLQKLMIYKKAGIKHYWIVHPEERTLECFCLREDLYTLVAAGMDEEVIEHPDFPGLAVALKDLWG